MLHRYRKDTTMVNLFRVSCVGKTVNLTVNIANPTSSTCVRNDGKAIKMDMALL